jgi:hypothetical protein
MIWYRSFRSYRQLRWVLPARDGRYRRNRVDPGLTVRVGFSPTSDLGMRRKNSWPLPDQWVAPLVRYARNSPKTAARRDDGYWAGNSVGEGAFITGGGFDLPVSASLFGIETHC